MPLLHGLHRSGCFCCSVVLSLAVEFAPHVTEVCQELQDADEEVSDMQRFLVPTDTDVIKEREPELPERPPVGPALIRGMMGSLRQATVLFVRHVIGVRLLVVNVLSDADGSMINKCMRNFLARLHSDS